MIGRVLKAHPTLLKVGIADMLAYRTEFFIWVLTTNMPLVMLAVWHAAAEDAPVGRFSQADFAAYYLAMLVVRQLVSSWVMWELTMDIRQGTLAMKLMRPIHPVVAYSAEQLAALPMRIIMVSPIVVILVSVAGAQLALGDPVMLVMFLASVAGAWLLSFFIAIMIGTLAMFIHSAMAVFDLWMALHALLSGYLIPLELFPAWVTQASRWLPFKYTLGFPVEIAVGLQTVESAAGELLVQWGYVGVMFLACQLMWRAGIKRFVAFGG